jgi:transposase
MARGDRGPDPAGCSPTRPTPAQRSARTCAGAGSRPQSRSPPTRSAAGSAGGRPPAFGPAACKQRNTVERAFGKLRQHRAVATRFDKRDFVWRGTVDVASIRIWLRDPPHDLQDTL